MKKLIVVVFCVVLCTLTGCSSIRHILGGETVPTTVIIDDITYRNGFYGDLYPVFGMAGDIGSDTLQDEIILDDGIRQFHRVGFEGHDWIHSYIGEYSGGVVYCAENDWEQMNDYYTNPDNFQYYYGSGFYICETSVNIPEMDPHKLAELLAFGKENNYAPFDNRSNKKAERKTYRIPESEFGGSVCFYKVSNDGYFSSPQSPLYTVHDGKLSLVFYHDGGRKNGGVKEVVLIDVPNELGQYFVDLI